MRTSMRARRVELSRELETHVRRQSEQALGRLEEGLIELSVGLEADRGSRPGREFVCRLSLLCSDGQGHHVHGEHACIEGAVSLAFRKLSRTLGRSEKRRVQEPLTPVLPAL